MSEKSMSLSLSRFKAAISLVRCLGTFRIKPLLASRRFSRRNNPNHLVFARKSHGMGDDQKNASDRLSDSQPALLTVNDPVPCRDQKRVVKHQAGGFEADAVL